MQILYKHLQILNTNFSKISNFYAQWLVIYRPETKKAFWSVKLPFEGKI